MWRGPSGGRALLVAGTEPPDVVELWDWTLHPGEAHNTEAHSTGTRELLLVLDGQVELRVGDRTERLSAGDSAAFAGDLAHGYAAPADTPTPARFALTVFEPNVGGAEAANDQPHRVAGRRDRRRRGVRPAPGLPGAAAHRRRREGRGQRRASDTSSRPRSHRAPRLWTGSLPSSSRTRRPGATPTGPSAPNRSAPARASKPCCAASTRTGCRASTGSPTSTTPSPSPTCCPSAGKTAAPTSGRRGWSAPRVASRSTPPRAGEPRRRAPGDR